MKKYKINEIRSGYTPFKLGIIQSRGFGDMIIAMPICKYYYNKGHEIHMVVDQQYVDTLSYAFPYVIFHGVYDEEKNLVGNLRNTYWYEKPKEILQKNGCEKIISFPYDEINHINQIGDLVSRLSGEYETQAVQKNLTYHLNFDQFKYAVSGVPFKEKWNLDLRRDLKREYEFFNRVVKNPNCYMVTQTNVNNGTINLNIQDFSFFKNLYGNELEIIKIDKLTDNIFDWLTVIEKSCCFLGIDSSFVNIIDQLGFDIDKYFIQRSNTTFTPVLKEKWEHVRGVR